MRRHSIASRLGAAFGSLAVLLALLVLPALHPAHAARLAERAPALTALDQAAGGTAGECPLCRGLARVRSAPAGAGPGLLAASHLVLERALLEVTLPHSPARSISRARAPPPLA